MLAERDTPEPAQTPADRAKPGPDSTYTPEVAARICRLYATTSLSLVTILASSPDFPASEAFYKWRDAHEELRTMLARAREARADMFVEECGEIADTQALGEKVKVWKGEREVTTADMIEHRKLRIDTRLKLAKFLNPAKYGDKVEHSGSITLEALIAASYKLEAPSGGQAAAPAIEGTARVVEGPERIYDDEDGAL